MMAEPAFLLRISTAPESGHADELLELVLAGASLDVDLVVIFEGPAVAHLQKPHVQRWRQLTDFGLVPLYCLTVPNSDMSPEQPAVCIGDEDLDRLAAGRVVLAL
jgi:hypothetical protein